jgi:S1-C subfamily serine protease
VEVRLNNDDVFPVVGTKAVDQLRDLAIVQIAGFSLATVSLGDSSSVRPGERIMVIGNALGMLENSVTAGIVSGVRDLGGYRMIQMDAAISPGNSGGPVVNEKGDVIGVATLKLRTGESLNFAVPVNYARGLFQLPTTSGLAQLASNKPPPSLFNADANTSANSPPPFPTIWKSVTTNGVKYLRFDGDKLFVENALPNSLVQAGASSVVEFTREGDKWIGVHRERVNCRPMPLTRRKICPVTPLLTTITMLTPTRIEGLGEHQLYLQPSLDAGNSEEAICTVSAVPVRVHVR